MCPWTRAGSWTVSIWLLSARHSTSRQQTYSAQYAVVDLHYAICCALLPELRFDSLDHNVTTMYLCAPVTEFPRLPAPTPQPSIIRVVSDATLRLVLNPGVLSLGKVPDCAFDSVLVLAGRLARSVSYSLFTSTFCLSSLSSYFFLSLFAYPTTHELFSFVSAF